MADRVKDAYRIAGLMAEALAAAAAPRVGPDGLEAVPARRFLKALMVLRGVSTVDVARAVGITPALVTNTTNGWERNAKVIKHLTDLLGVPADLLFVPRGVSNDSIDRNGNEINGCDDPACRHERLPRAARG